MLQLAALAASTAAGRLRELALHECAHVTDDGIVALAAGCRHLCSVSLAHTAVGDRGVQALASGCRELTRLRLDGCRIGEPSVRALAGACHALRHLSVDGCDVSCAALTQLLPPALPSLRTVVLGKRWGSRAGHASALTRESDERRELLHELRSRRTDLQVFRSGDSRDLRLGSRAYWPAGRADH